MGKVQDVVYLIIERESVLVGTKLVEIRVIRATQLNKALDNDACEKVFVEGERRLVAVFFWCVLSSHTLGLRPLWRRMTELKRNDGCLWKTRELTNHLFVITA